jgi:hypothetical protein
VRVVAFDDWEQFEMTKSAIESVGTFEGAARVALEISKRQAAQLRVIKNALGEGNTDAALMTMRHLLAMCECDAIAGRCMDSACSLYKRTGENEHAKAKKPVASCTGIDTCEHAKAS